ncbi:MAG: hypothetical protein M0R49_02255 [Limnochordia bacterium]|nr:hypothetical protein [Limnochordia bacterium]
MKRAGETFGGALNAHEERINAHFQPVMGRLRQGQYIPDIPAHGYSSYAPPAGSLYAGIFLATTGILLDSLALFVAEPATAGKLIRLGIYSCRDDMYPGTLLLDAGTVTADEAERRELAINHTLECGYYYLAVLVEESCGLRYLKLSQSPLGIYTTFNAVYTGFGCQNGWGLLPEVFPAEAMASNIMRMVIARVAKTL